MWRRQGFRQTDRILPPSSFFFNVSSRSEIAYQRRRSLTHRIGPSRVCGKGILFKLNLIIDIFNIAKIKWCASGNSQLNCTIQKVSNCASFSIAAINYLLMHFVIMILFSAMAANLLPLHLILGIAVTLGLIVALDIWLHPIHRVKAQSS
jgi:predicted RND superfamily exporter protein